jgi:hypothetical protein
MDPSVVAGNELMAKYMGGIKCVPSWEKEKGSNRPCWIIPMQSDYVYQPLLPELLHFHDSWDWLLPVWILWLHEFINNPISKIETFVRVKQSILSGNLKGVWDALKDQLEEDQAKLN